jgi:hypothetical protein
MGSSREKQRVRKGGIYDQVHDVDDPTGLAPVVKKAGCCGATPLFQRLPPPAQGRWAAEAHRIADAPHGKSGCVFVFCFSWLAKSDRVQRIR